MFSFEYIFLWLVILGTAAFFVHLAIEVYGHRQRNKLGNEAMRLVSTVWWPDIPVDQREEALFAIQRQDYRTVIEILSFYEPTHEVLPKPAPETDPGRSV